MATRQLEVRRWEKRYTRRLLLTDSNPTVTAKAKAPTPLENIGEAGPSSFPRGAI